MLAAFLLTIAFSGAVQAAAQTSDTLDPTLTPNFGGVTLSEGFTPDPFTQDMVAGGEVDASTAGTDPGCTGYVTLQPDYRIKWSGRESNLRLFFLGTDDTAMIVQTPAGRWMCSDNTYDSVHPTIDIAGPDEGDYFVWVGSYSATQYVSGTLYITKTSLTPTEEEASPDAALTLNPNATPNFTTLELAGGFTPDPTTADIVAGGNLDASRVDPNCDGYVSSSPDVRLVWSGNTNRLRIFFAGDDDTTLIVNDPSGSWLCSDDSFNTVHPALDLIRPAEGVYNIWIGAFHGSSYVSGQLYITTTTLSPTDVAIPTDTLSAALDPNYGEVDLAGGFTPDPFTKETSAGGEIDASTVSTDCSGYVTAAPDLRVNWTGQTAKLRILFVGRDDTTLTIQDPAGNWLCNDNSFNSFHPSVDIPNPAAGAYNLWIGSVDPTNDYIGGTIYISQTDVTPDTLPQAQSNQQPDPQATPNFDSRTLAAGFTPDPTIIDNIVAGGDINMAAIDPACTGFVTSAPDFRLTWSGRSNNLRLMFIGTDDTALAIQDPSGKWLCGDDASGTFHPVVDIGAPRAGVYNVWIGTFGNMAYVSGRLYITQTKMEPADAMRPGEK